MRELEHLVYREFLLADGPHITIPAPAGCPRPTVTEADGGRLTYREAKARAIIAFEKRFLTQVMQHAGGQVSVAARLIQTERRHLGRVLKKHGIVRVAHSA